MSNEIGRRGLTEHDDEAVVDRVLNGDPAAFEGIVIRWRKPLVNAAYRFCRDEGRAEELAQEAFLKAFRSLATWKRAASFSTWLFTVALNTFRNELRRTPPRSSPIEAANAIRDGRRLAADEIETRQRDETVRRLVLTLPRKYAEAITVFYFRDMDLAQAAAALSIPEGTLKARLHRARQLLRERIETRGIR